MIDDPRILAARLIAQSPLAISIADARARTQERRRTLLAAPPIPEPSIEPELVPIVDAPVIFARDFWKDKQLPAKPARAPRKTSHSSKQQRSPFRVIKGGKSGDKEK